jgi:hypothetical protein
MTTLDIRTKSAEPICTIVFAEKAGSGDVRQDVSSSISDMPALHPGYIFLQSAGGSSDYLAIRRSDVSNLILALQEAQELWGCK